MRRTLLPRLRSGRRSVCICGDEAECGRVGGAGGVDAEARRDAWGVDPHSEGVILGEVAREKGPAPAVRPSVEMEEITVLRLLLTNVLPKLATGETMTLEAHKGIVAEIKRSLCCRWESRC
jgi:hypothetical protein